MAIGRIAQKIAALSIGLLVLGGHFAWTTAARADDDLKVRFSWKLKGEYGPLYLAQEDGFFAAQHLAVRLGEGAGAPAALGALLQGQEDVVILPGIFAISAIQKGMPIKLIAIYHAKTPVVIISHPDNAVLKPKQMEGKSIVTSVGETGTSYLSTFAAENHVDFDKIKRVQVDAQIRVNYFLQNKVDMVSVYRTNDLPSVEEKTGIKFPILDMAEYGLAIPGLAAVSSDSIIAKKGDALRHFLVAFNQGIDATRKDPAAASKALLKAWTNGPSLSVVEAQVKATVDAIQPAAGHPAGWITAQQIKSSLDLIKTDEDIGTPKPAEIFFTNDLLPTKSGS
jgi:NitT/TauT family transport system substrate-binding protein